MKNQYTDIITLFYTCKDYIVIKNVLNITFVVTNLCMVLLIETALKLLRSLSNTLKQKETATCLAQF